MKKLADSRIYQGRGVTLQERGLTPPSYRDNSRLFAPEGYEPDEGLLDAVHVALALGQPLLLTGAPGSGKTQLASSVAWELNLPLLPFHTKSTSTYMDLLYRYDSLRHFQDVQLKRAEKAIEDYIEYGPLGEAIRLAMQDSKRSVVLVDEVDKAPRDFPNDILNEMERMSFLVKETGRTFQAEALYRPILIFTSNLEKDLPDAFRRRCVFYHIPPPSDERLASIVRKRLRLGENFGDQLLRNAIQLFQAVKKQGLEKEPGTAELLGWVELLNLMELDVKDGKNLTPEEKAALACSYSVLAKSDEDLKKLQASAAKTTTT